MRDVQFMVLTGHLDDYPLPSLIKTLYGQRKSGRLQVEYSESPAAFYFEQGKLVDARLGDLRGLEALLLALSLPGASFNFNPLVKPPERTFPEREQNLIRELLEASTGQALDTHAVSKAETGHLQIVYADDTALSAPMSDRPALPSPAQEHIVSEVKLLLAAHSRRFSRERAVYAALIAALLFFVVGSQFLTRSATPPTAKIVDSLQPAPQVVISQPTKSVTEESSPSAQTVSIDSGAGLTHQSEPASAPPAMHAERRRLRTPGKSTASNRASDRNVPRRATSGTAQTVSVVMQVTGGRVVQAKVQNSRPGMGSYEALALRMARQRRYPEGFNGQDTLQVRVKP